MRVAHTLIIGGSGMLRTATMTLAIHSDVTLIARTRQRLEDLRREAPRIHPVPLDYRDTGALIAAIDEAIASRGPIDLTIGWIHAVAPDAPLEIARCLDGQGQPTRYVDVCGSAVADPKRTDERAARFAAFPHVRRLEVILGWSGRRWLTHAEISGGVIDAIAADRDRTIVGRITPWSDRP